MLSNINVSIVLYGLLVPINSTQWLGIEQNITGTMIWGVISGWKYALVYILHLMVVYKLHIWVL